VIVTAPPHPPDAEHVDERGRALLIESIVRAVAGRVDVARSEIERAVDQTLVRFEGARVTQYVPLLVERAVLDRLRRVPKPR
jgi:hypothetical protein